MEGVFFSWLQQKEGAKSFHEAFVDFQIAACSRFFWLAGLATACSN
jgi:hypothetical protein